MSIFMVTLTRIISVIMSVVLIPVSGITYGLDVILFPDRSEQTGITNIVGLETLFRTQGVTCDGENLYFSAKTTIIKTEADGRMLINANLSAISDELSGNYGIKHIGGISYYNGKIYAGMEDSKVWKYPTIGVYDADTLQLEKYYIMDDIDPDTGNLVISRGMPWVAVNPDDGCLYCMDHSKTPTKILVYDINNEMSFVREVKLSETVEKIQGGEFLNGKLYVATNNDTAAIYTIDVNNGTVEKFTDRNLHGGEGEGMTFIKKDDKDVLLAIDLGTIFINAFMREYEITQ